MSHVTNIILVMEQETNRLPEVNSFLVGRFGRKGLVSLEDPALAPHWYGGDKRFEAELFVGAFNHLDLDGFVSHLRSIPWREPQLLQLIVREQEDEKFRVLDLRVGGPIGDPTAA